VPHLSHPGRGPGSPPFNARNGGKRQCDYQESEDDKPLCSPVALIWIYAEDSFDPVMPEDRYDSEDTCE
jgi:hypothetical protein